MLSSHSPNRLVYAQKQEYTFRWIGWKKVCVSLIDDLSCVLMSLGYRFYRRGRFERRRQGR